MQKKEINIRVQEAENINELEEKERELVEISRDMTSRAYAPYSGFFVGAALLLENGEIITGSNQENSAYPSGLCAERVAVFAASSLHPGVKMKTIAISARSQSSVLDQPVSPCGACRQVMLEYEIFQDQPIKILLSKDNGKIIIFDSTRDLLPFSFSGSYLKKN